MARTGIIAQTTGETAIHTGGSDPDKWGAIEQLNLTPAQVAESIQRITNFGLSNNTCHRFYIDGSWPKNTNDGVRHRVEVGTPNNVQLNINNTYWASVSIFIADNENNRRAASSTKINVHALQWHDVDGPSTSGINIRGSEFIAAVGSSGSQSLGPVVFGQWNVFVYNFRLSSGSDGFVNIWLNPTSADDAPTYTDTGSNMRSGITQLNPKMGIYRNWINPDSSITETYNYVEYYYDEYRIGNSSSSFLDVYPDGAGGITPPPVVEDIITSIPDLIHDGEIGVTVQLEGTIAATGKKVWLEQEIDGQSTMVEQVVTAEDATSVTFNCDYQEILRNGLANLHIGDPQ